MTLPSVLVPLGNTAAIVAVPDVLFLTLDLLFSPLNSEDTDAAKLYETPDIYLPENMSYTVLSTQRIALQQFSSGVHEYFSITFDDRNYTLLDLMVHCCITAVHYNHVAFYPELQPPRRRLPPDLVKNGTTSTLKDAGPTAVSDGTGGSQIRRTRVSTTIDTSNSQQTGSKSAPKSSFFRLPTLFLNPEKILFGDHHPSDQSSTQRNTGSDVNSDSYVTKVTVNPITMASAFKRRVSSSVSSSMIGSKLPSGTAEEASDSIAAALDPEDNQETASVVSSPDVDDNLTVDTSTTTTAGEEDEGAASEELTCSGDSSTVSPKDCSSGFVAPSAERIAEVYDLYTAPIIRNHQDAVKAIQSLLHAASELESSAEFADSNVQNRLLSHSVVEGSDKDDAVVPTTDSIMEEVEPYACLLKTRRLNHIEALVNLANHYSKGSDINGTSVSTPTNRTPRSKIALNRSLTVVLHEFLDRGHEQLALQWSLFTATLRRLLYPLRQLLYPKYLAEQSIFWKQQMISHTRPYAGSHVIASAKDSEMWDILAQHITVEREHERQKLLRPLQHPRHHLGRGRYARGLHVFDWQLFRLPSRLPYLLTETYSQNDIGPISSTLTNSERLSNSSDTSDPAAGDQDEAARAEERLLQSPNTSIYERRQSRQHMRGHSNSIAGSNSDDYICRRQPVHVIVLQHGFLGSAFDMRLLSHALQALLSPTEAPRKPASTHNNKKSSNTAANRLKGALFSDEEMTPSSSCKSQKIPPISRNHNQEQEQTSPTVATAPSHKVLVHCCTSNEGTPSSLSGIREMGQRFADELVAFLREKAPSLLFTPPASFHYDPLKSDDLFSCPDRISFIGHSLGGLIIRSALQEDSLQPLRDKLHVFMSLATPHVGNLFSDSSLVSTGMWALAKFKNYRCLQELVLEDGGKDLNLVPDVLARENGGSNGSSNGSSSGSGRKGEGATSGTEEQNQERRHQQLAQREARITTQAAQLVGQSSLLYRLSLPVVPLSSSSSGSTSTSDSASGGGVRVTRNALRDFRHVLLVSSPKDQYVSTYSARIQVCNDTRDHAYITDHLLSFLPCLVVHRYPQKLSKMPIREVFSASRYAR